MKISYSIILIFLLSLSYTGHSQTAQEYYKNGLAKEELNDFTGAIVNYNKAIEINPMYTEAYAGRGFAKGQLKDFSGAITDYTKAIEIVPEYPDELAKTYFYRGNAKRELKDYRGAITDCTKAIEIIPKFAEAYYLRGTAKIKLGLKDSGCLDFSKAGELGFTDAYDLIKKLCQ